MIFHALDLLIFSLLIALWTSYKPWYSWFIPIYNKLLTVPYSFVVITWNPVMFSELLLHFSVMSAFQKTMGSVQSINLKSLSIRRYRCKILDVWYHKSLTLQESKIWREKCFFLQVAPALYQVLIEVFVLLITPTLIVFVFIVSKTK